MIRTGVKQETLRAEQITAFSERIAPLGVQVHQVPSVLEAADIVREVAGELVVSTLLVSSELFARFPELEQALLDRGLEVQVATDPQSSLDAPLGLTTARNAIVETGSLLMSEASLADRSVAMLSLTCMAIVPSNAMIAGLEEAARAVRAEARKPGGAYSTFVTGPSRTADIELSLTVGVQGPGRIVVVFVDNP